MRPHLWRLACCLALGITDCSFAAPTTVTLENRVFQVEAGFTLERAAGSDLAPRPVSASLDDKGRLYVTDSSGSNQPPAEQLKNPTHRILRLEDTNNDGVYDKSVVFAEKVMFPQGCLWHDGWVYVAAPPSIWRFRDTNNDGISDQREEWFKGGTLTGCANDIHGPQLGPDGYLYWTKGAFAEQNHPRPGKSPIHDRAAHILRAKPDGSDLEIVMTGGMDNPVEIAFTPDGEPLFTSTFIDFSEPGRRDGIGHAVYGGVFGKENSVLEDRLVVRTGPDLLHPFVQFGAGAPSGLCRYQSSAFGPGFKDNLFATTFNLHKVSRHALRADGSTYASTDTDFVVSEDVDFRPTDVLEDADGSLLIVDTGGWYKLCCPTAQLAKPDVLGGIYRVRRTGYRHVADAGSRRRLVGPPTATGPLWKLKQAALTRDKRRLGEFRTLLKNHVEKNTPGDASVRIAAEGLGRLSDTNSVSRLLDAAGKATEPQLQHAFIFALTEIGDIDALRAALTEGEAGRRRAALIALDQIPEGALKSSEVLPLLAEGNSPLWLAARWIVSRHSEWSDQMVGWFQEQLSTPATRGNVAGQLRFLAPSEAGRALLAETARRSSNGQVVRRAAFNAMAEANPKQPPIGWNEAIIESLRDADAELVRTVIPVARGQAANVDVRNALRRTARTQTVPEDVRTLAFAALPAGWLPTAEDFEALLSTGPSREAAGALARASLTPTLRLTLAAKLRTAGPMELLALLPAFESGGDEIVGVAVMNALQNAASRATLRADLVRNLIKKYPQTVQDAGLKLVDGIDAEAAHQAENLDKLMAELKPLTGDIRRGQAIFLGAKAACYTCHKIGYRGGLVGPDLTRIGEARTERDLLESIVYPSASFVRSYEPVVLATRDGTDIQGIIRSETDREFLVISGPGAEQRIPRSSVTSQKPGNISLMPAGLDAQLSRQELADLLTFLRNTRWGAN
jgi:putative membrane-bound dehydrogenase-like protein